MVEKYRALSVLFFGTMWIILSYGFISEELIPPLISIKSFVFLLCDFIFLILGLCTLRDKHDRLLVITFLLLCIISSWLNHVGVIHFLNGFRDFLGLLFAVPIIRYMLQSKYHDRFVKSFDKQLLIFLVLQCICVTWQFIKYGANDHGGGSMGYGYSGILSSLIYISSFYLLSKNWTFSSYWGELLKNMIYLLFLFPTFLNETKISILFFLAYFLLLLKIEWKTVLKVLISMPIFIVGIIGVGMIYLTVTGADSDSVFTDAALNEYLVGDDPEEFIELAMAVQDEIYVKEDIGLLDVPRFTKIAFIPEALKDSKGGLIFGAGIGQFKGGTVMENTAYAEEWQWLLSGSIPYLFEMLIQLGILGGVWLLYNLITLLRPHSHLPMGLNIKLFVCIILTLVMFYNDSLRYYPFCAILFYIVLTTYVQPPKLQAESL